MKLYPLLAVRSDFSLGESIVGIKSLPDIAERLQTDVVGIVDTMSVSSMVEATKKLAKSNKRVLTGVRMRVIMEEGKEEAACYLKLYPVNEDGMKSIYRLLTRSFMEDRFYYVPRVTWGDLKSLIVNDSLVISAGDADSVLQREDMREALIDLVSSKSFCASFYELVPCTSPYWSQHNKLSQEFGYEHGWEPLTVMPTLWDGDHSHTFSINASIAEKRPYEDYLRPVSNYTPQSIKDLAAMCREASDAIALRYGDTAICAFGQGLKNTQTLVGICDYKWEPQAPSLPIVEVEPDKALHALCMKGFKERFTQDTFGHRPSKDDLAAQYVPRLKFELETLTRLGFSQYFLLVSDLVLWAKSQDIYVGPGRGSVGGSLVAYLVGITDVDPVRFGLLFERFINPDRLDLPDADLDFMSTRRHEVVTYLEGRWGKSKVAGIVNYNTLAAKSALKDVGRILGITDMSVTRHIGDNHGIGESLTEAHEESLEVQEFAIAHPAAWEHALLLEGSMRAYGTHAAGVIVAGVPLVDRAAVEQRGSKGSGRARVINWDKRVSEEQGLIKLDVLGLSALDMFDQAVKLIVDRHGIKVDLNKIDLDDEKTLEVFNAAKTHGIFQFEGGSVRRLLKDMASAKPITFEDLVALNALNRPGPLDAGLAESYIKRRAGKEAITYPHPTLEPILKETFGVMAYQEQIMQITRTLSGFTPGEADGVRKAIGKKDLDKMAAYQDKFVEGAVTLNGMDEMAAQRLWRDIEGFAAYSFNKSHSVEYSLISFQAAWLKAHYAVEFYCGQMGTTKDDKLAILAKKAALEGIDIIPPDVNVSTGQFRPRNDTTIVAPLTSVMGVSEKGAIAILQARNATEPTVIEKTSGRGKAKVTTTTTYGPGPFVSIEDFQARVAARACNQRSVDNLNKVGAFAAIEPGQRPPMCASRQKDQIELMPTLADQGVMADRSIELDDIAADTIADIEARMIEALGENAVPSHLGSAPKMMIVLDAPLNDYEDLPKQYSYLNFIQPALHEAGLTPDDAVWSWVIRRPLEKGESTPPEEEVAKSIPFLQAEVALMKPPVIVLLGTTAIKQFFPDIKRPSENVGHKAFNANLDATVIVGFKPTQIYFDAAKVETLTEIFSEAKRLTE